MHAIDRHRIDRRTFVRQALAGTSLLLAGPLVAQEQEVAPREKLLPSATDRVPLGKSGLVVPRLALGTGTNGWQKQSNQTRLGKEAFARLVAHGVDSGAAFLDVADLYGTHDFVKHALRTVPIPRDRVTILTKIWFAEAPGMTPATSAKPEVERFCKEMGVEMLDICLIHCVQDPEWPVQLEKIRDDLSELKEKGVARAVGCSCHTHAALKVAAEHPWVDVILARINHLHKAMDGDATNEEVAATLRKARAAGKGVIGMKIFGCGALKTPEERQASLDFSLRNGLVDTMTIGFLSAAEIDDAMNGIGRALRA
ncbi:MAG: aldo/keto reductase [Planctomycetota bacterium]